jgi:hypothetical protein
MAPYCDMARYFLEVILPLPNDMAKEMETVGLKRFTYNSETTTILGGSHTWQVIRGQGL